MYYIVYLMCILLCAQLQSSPYPLDPEPEISITLKTECINRRYYFVARLKQAIELLTTIKQQNSKFFVMNQQIDFNNLVDFEGCQAFKHNRIQTCIQEMKRKKTLTPLYSVWDDFSAYKFIEDTLFIDEFTKEIFVISRNLLLHVMPHEMTRSLKPSIADLFEEGMRQSTDSIIDYIDVFTDTFKKISSLHHVDFRQKSLFRISDLNQEVHTNEVSSRFYHINRMLNNIMNLKKFENDKNIFAFSPSPENLFAIFDNRLSFHHGKIIHCIEEIEFTLSLKPLFSLWEEYKQFKYVTDKQFDREFFSLVYLTYWHLAINYNVQSQTRGSITDAAQIIEKLNSLPVDEIIEAIDIIAEVIQISGLTKNITWKQWSHDYWWVGPTVVASMLYTYLTHG